MVDLGVALTWIAISAASVKGLSAFARAGVTENVEVEQIREGPRGHDSLFPTVATARLLEERG